MKNVPCVVLSSSLGEVFDYVFGKNENYYPFWASGWSARGFLKEPYDGYLFNIMENIDRNANVIIDFGFVDFFMNARYIRHKNGAVSLNEIKNSAIRGMDRAEDILKHMGFNNVYATITASIADLPREYWKAIGGADQFNNEYIARHYYDYYLEMRNKNNFIDILSKVTESPDRPFTLGYYQRKKYNHHDDYTKTCHVVWDSIKDIPNMQPRRGTFHDKLYPHKAVGISELKLENETRKNTCM